MNPIIPALLSRAAEISASTGESKERALARAYREVSGRDVGKGNIDLNQRPEVKNPDGSVSTVYSMTFEDDGKQVLVPGVRPGLDRQMTDTESLDWYKKTGQHLGKFGSTKEADAYAEQLHRNQAKIYPQK